MCVPYFPPLAARQNILDTPIDFLIRDYLKVGLNGTGGREEEPVICLVSIGNSQFLIEAYLYILLYPNHNPSNSYRFYMNPNQA